MLACLFVGQKGRAGLSKCFRTADFGPAGGLGLLGY